MNRIFLLTIAFTLSLQGIAQKLKYKDIYLQLEAGRYDETEPYLKNYVFDPKNDDHANSHLQLGYIFERKLLAADILKDTTYVYGWADSAVLYMGKAKLLIDEKELKKKDEYYQSFYRRDLRSGEFGIKISDVHLEIEKKIENAKNRGQNILEVNESLKKANENYNNAVAKFSQLNNQFSSYNLFLLKSNNQTKDDLRAITSEGSASKAAISNMRRALSLIENPGFGPEFKYKPIDNFPQADVAPADFYKGEFDLWDLDGWGYDALDKIEGDIEPLKSELIAYDRELTDYKANLFAGGTNGSGALSFDEGLMNKINKYDEGSILKEVIDVKLRDINILKVYAPTLNIKAADKENIDYQLELADSLVTIYEELAVVVDKLATRNVDEEYNKYNFFFDNRMKGKSGLTKFIDDQQSNAKEQGAYWQDQYNYWLETSKWGLMEFGSIPLYVVDSLLPYPNDSIRYLTLTLTRDDSLNIYPVGIEFGPKNKGYLANVAQNRDGLWYQTLDLGKMTVGDTAISVTAKITPSAPDQLTFYYYSPTSKKDNFIIFNFQKSGSLVWRNALQLEKEPFEVKFNETVFETILYMDDPAAPPADGSLQYTVIDRAGKVRN